MEGVNRPNLLGFLSLKTLQFRRSKYGQCFWVVNFMRRSVYRTISVMVGHLKRGSKRLKGGLIRRERTSGIRSGLNRY
jgi:hypothetical protein